MKALLTLLLLLLTACGGGGGAGTPGTTVTESGTVRRDLLFGYYGGCDSCALEAQDHITMYWTGLHGLDSALAEVQQAQSVGIRNIVLMVPAYEPNGLELTRQWLAAMVRIDAKLVALYPIDEPDQHGKTDAEVTAVNRELHAMANLPLAVIYNCASQLKPGIKSYDWVGCDFYNQPCSMLSEEELQPGQRLMLVPGGADPWREDPGCMMRRAHSDSRVVAVPVFILQDNAAPGVGRGVRSNGMRKVYCQAGRVIKTGSAAGC